MFVFKSAVEVRGEDSGNLFTLTQQLRFYTHSVRRHLATGCFPPQGRQTKPGPCSEPEERKLANKPSIARDQISVLLV